MGHYDSCYAYDDYKSMTDFQKQVYFNHYDKEIAKNDICISLDDVGGYILCEWADNRGYEFKLGRECFVKKQDVLLVKAIKAVI